MTAQMKRLLHAVLFTPGVRGTWGLPLLCWGDPGTGKTSVGEQVCRDAGFAFETFSPGERGEGALGCVPVPGEDGLLHYPAPAWSARFLDGAGVVIVDEYTTSPPAMQPALLGLVLDRRIGGKFLGARVRVIAFANELEDAAGGGYDPSAANANRFGHVQWDAGTVADWSAFLLGAGEEPEVHGNVDAEESRVLAVWSPAFAKAKGLVSAFLRSRPELLHRKPKSEDPALSRAWPSRRTWEMATRALAGAQVHGLTDVDADALVAAFVGGAAAAEFRTFIAAMDLPDPEKLLDRVVAWEHNPKRLDRTMAVLSACTALVVPVNAAHRITRANVLVELIATTLDTAPDVGVPAMIAIIAARLMPHVRENIRPILAAMAPMLAKAGVQTT